MTTAITGGTRVSSITDTTYMPKKSNIPACLSDSLVKKSLCSLGGKTCASCQMCEYGKEYVRRVQGGMSAKRETIKTKKRIYAARALKRYRDTCGMTNREAARRLGIKESYFSRIIHVNVRFSAEEVIKKLNDTLKTENQIAREKQRRAWNE